MKFTPLLASMAILVVCSSANLANAAQISISLPDFSGDIRTTSDGGAYSPLYPTSDMTLAGVDFQFRSDLNGNNVFFGGVSTIPVNVASVSTVYAIINTFAGSVGSNTGSIRFEGSAGAVYEVDLISGVNVRDHYFGNYANSTTDPNTTQSVFGENAPRTAHYDMVAFSLPGAFSSESLSNIVFNSEQISGNGIAVLAAVTVETRASTSVPDGGSTLAFFGLSFLGLSCFRKNANIRIKRTNSTLIKN